MRPKGAVDLAAAGERRWDVAVVGAGPAGALAARELALGGASVLLIDKAAFPRPKVCGSCLNKAAVSVLEAVGLGGLVGRLGAVPLRDVFLAAGGRSARVPLPGGAAVSREALDAALVDEAVQAGATFLPRTTAAVGPAGAQARTLMLERPGRREQIEACCILAANGLGSRLLARSAGAAQGSNARDRLRRARSRIGAGVIVPDGPAFYRPGTIYLACGPAGYVGLTRLEDGRLDVAAALDPKAVREAGHPGVLAGSILAELAPVPALADNPWRGTPYLTRRPAQVAAHRIFAIGDAAGYVEPFTGEGIAWALASARAVAPFALRTLSGWDPRLVREWGAVYRQTILSRQLVCRGAAQVLRHPVLTAGLVGLLSHLPDVARPVVARLNRPWQPADAPLTPAGLGVAR